MDERQGVQIKAEVVADVPSSIKIADGVHESAGHPLRGKLAS